jgi:formylmethanofuran:tetrahydromethanopterin formyltransferase
MSAARAVVDDTYAEAFKRLYTKILIMVVNSYEFREARLSSSA